MAQERAVVEVGKMLCANGETYEYYLIVGGRSVHPGIFTEENVHPSQMYIRLHKKYSCDHEPIPKDERR